jgi:hypothetical protein
MCTLAAAGFALHDRDCRLEVLDPPGDIRRARCPRRATEAFVIHGPDVENGVGEHVHHGIVAVREYQIKTGKRRQRRAVNQKQYWKLIIGLVSEFGGPSAIYRKPHAPFVGPIVLAPELGQISIAENRGLSSGLGGREAGTKSGT